MSEVVSIRRIWPEGAWPCFCPDGRQLVFAGHLDRPHSCLMLWHFDGSQAPTIITPRHINARRPTWLDGGSELAFNRDQKTIWSLDVTSGHLAPFCAERPAKSPPYFHPCAYPKERAVAVVAHCESKDGRQSVLFKLAPGSANPVVQLTDPRQVFAGRPGVGPDGETVVFSGNAGRFDQGANQLWLVRPNAAPRRLETGPLSLIQGRAPRWSPDGKWIACTSTRPAPKPDESTPKAVWIISADGQRAYQLTDCSFNPLHVAWSPDQKQLACGGVSCGLGLLDVPDRFHRQPAGDHE